MGPGAALLGGIYSRVSSSKLQGRKAISPSLFLLTYMEKYILWDGQKQGHKPSYGNQHILQKSSAVSHSVAGQTAAGQGKKNMCFVTFWSPGLF